MSRSIRRRSFAFLILITVFLTSCAHIAGKTVVRKDGPNILVAGDGSICVVSQERFDKTEVGMKALCGWRGGQIPRPRTGPLQGAHR